MRCSIWMFPGPLGRPTKPIPSRAIRTKAAPVASSHRWAAGPSAPTCASSPMGWRIAIRRMPTSLCKRTFIPLARRRMSLRPSGCISRTSQSNHSWAFSCRRHLAKSATLTFRRERPTTPFTTRSRCPWMSRRFPSRATVCQPQRSMPGSIRLPTQAKRRLICRAAINRNRSLCQPARHSRFACTARELHRIFCWRRAPIARLHSRAKAKITPPTAKSPAIRRSRSMQVGKRLAPGASERFPMSRL